ncbi:MAG: serine protease [Thermoleophilia bacterium]
MRRTLLLALLLVAAVAAAPAAAALPDDLSGDPLDRGVLLATPSVYRIQAEIPVEGVRLGDRVWRLPAGHRFVAEMGTAVVVAPGGWVVTARHVARPTAKHLTRLALAAVRERLPTDAAEPPDDPERVTAVGARPDAARITLVPADVDADPDTAEAPDPRLTAGQPIVAADGADLALLKVPALEKAPALALDEAHTFGTPVASIGFGGDAFDTDPANPVMPAVRRGEIGRSARFDDPDGAAPGRDRQVMLITVPIESGDSGAPVVDARGALRGIVIRSGGDGGTAELATEVRVLLRQRRVATGASPSADHFAAGMRNLWAMRMAAAREQFDAALRIFPGHRLATREQARVDELVTAETELLGRRRRPGALLALASIAIAAAAACGVALLRLGGRPRGAR